MTNKVTDNSAKTNDLVDGVSYNTHLLEGLFPAPPIRSNDYPQALPSTSGNDWISQERSGAQPKADNDWISQERSGVQPETDNDWIREERPDLPRDRDSINLDNIKVAPNSDAHEQHGSSRIEDNHQSQKAQLVKHSDRLQQSGEVSKAHSNRFENDEVTAFPEAPTPDWTPEAPFPGWSPDSPTPDAAINLRSAFPSINDILPSLEIDFGNSGIS